MGLLDIFKKKPKAEAPAAPEVREKVVPLKKKSPKELATERGEPYVAIVSLDINPENMHEGAFELDWNDKFVSNLVRAGYQMKPNEPEDVIVDRWFQNICRHVVMETYEQEEAIRNSGVYVKTTDLGGGRKEVS